MVTVNNMAMSDTTFQLDEHIILMDNSYYCTRAIYDIIEKLSRDW